MFNCTVTRMLHWISGHHLKVAYLLLLRSQLNVMLKFNWKYPLLKYRHKRANSRVLGTVQLSVYALQAVTHSPQLVCLERF